MNRRQRVVLGVYLLGILVTGVFWVPWDFVIS